MCFKIVLQCYWIIHDTGKILQMSHKILVRSWKIHFLVCFIEQEFSLVGIDRIYWFDHWYSIFNKGKYSSSYKLLKQKLPGQFRSDNYDFHPGKILTQNLE